MLPTRLACVVCLSLALGVWTSTATIAKPAASVAGSAAQSTADKLTHKRSSPGGCPRWAATPTTPAPARGGWVLLGQRRIWPSEGQEPAGVALGFAFRAGLTGEISSVHVYLDTSNRARRLMVALYSNSGCRPGSRLTHGSLAIRLTRPHRGRRSPSAGAGKGDGWRVVEVPGVRIASGRTYWLVVLGAGGTLRFREESSKRCTSQASPDRHLRSMPKSWKPGGSKPRVRNLGVCGWNAD